MTVRNLEYLMQPSSIALIGASEKRSTVGKVIADNLLGAGFEGRIFLVNPHYSSLAGQKCYPNIEALPAAPDLALIATPPWSVPGVVKELALRGTKACVVVTAGFGEGGDEEGRRLCREMLDAARPHLLRIVGPNCLGIIAPGAGINASLSHIARPYSGKIAFVAQSGAVQTTVLDWAVSQGIGFSYVVSLGDMADVDFGDMLDYLTMDHRTHAILLYMESITHARKFMSAARAASRVKPVIVLKAGRFEESAGAASRHTGAVAGDDALCDAAFRRAGMLRVYRMQALFDAVETLAMMKRAPAGDRLAILTNGGGAGVIATDALIEKRGTLVHLSPGTIRKLDQVLPPTWSHGNPVDIVSDAPSQRYAQALKIILEDERIDAVLVLFCPVAVVSGEETAAAVIQVYNEARERTKAPLLLTSWMGHQAAEEARQLFSRHGIPTFSTPLNAIRAFMHMVNYQRSKELLMETPSSIPESFSPDVALAMRVIDGAMADKRHRLSGAEVKSILSAYAIPMDFEADSMRPVHGTETTARHQSTDLCHRSRPYELVVKVTEDSCFGPIISIGRLDNNFGEIEDRVVALPPLNMHLAREALLRSRIYRRLQSQKRLAVGLRSLIFSLVKVSQIICDIPEIVELELNPLRVDASGATVAGAQIRVKRSLIQASEKLAIRPYPKELEDTYTTTDGRLLQIRPMRPEDELGFVSLFESLSYEEKRMRFLYPLQELSHLQAARLTQIDYDREMSLVAALGAASGGRPQELCGTVCILADPDNELAEYSILVRTDFAGKGLGKMLMRRIIDYARSRCIREIFGLVSSDNIPMLRVCHTLGFGQRRELDNPGVITVFLKL